MLIFVTCGRGFSHFVVEEVKERFKDTTYHVIDEGKVLFCFQNHVPNHLCKSCLLIERSQHKNTLAPIAQKHFVDVNETFIESLLNLKLVEKVFLLLNFLPSTTLKNLTNFTSKLSFFCCLVCCFFFNCIILCGR